MITQHEEENGTVIKLIELGNKDVLIDSSIYLKEGFPVISFQNRYGDKDIYPSVETIISFSNLDSLNVLQANLDGCRRFLVLQELVNTETWNNPSQLPTPDIKLYLLLDNDVVVEGIRPDYISSKSNEDLGYRILGDNDNVIDVKGWIYQ